jgi:LmbE family N-acetylglucosaminyl deacetylase
VQAESAGDHASARLLVVAHPDDETLWLEPWLGDDTVVVVAFADSSTRPALSAARHAVRTRFPYGAMEFLGLDSLEVLGRSDWRRRSPTGYGVELDAACPVPLLAAYQDNYSALRERLEPYLAAHPVVVTHNPWGEYGHEEHVQVCRAVLDVGASLGTCVWAWDGLSSAALAASSMRLRDDFYGRRVEALPRVSRAADLARYRELKRLYEDANAWTWDPDYEPPPMPAYVELMHGGQVLLPPSPPSLAARNARILANHVRHAPRVARRAMRDRRLRGR